MSRVNMDLRLIAVSTLLGHICGAYLLQGGGHQTLPTARLEYRPDMTSMWMTDDHGQQVEVHLTEEFGSHAVEMNAENHVFFYLYTREYNSAYQIYHDDYERLVTSSFDSTRPTKVLVHGFENSYLSDAEQLIREAYLNYQNVNIVAVDWGALCKSPWYFSAVAHVKAVGQQVALLIDFLVNSGADVDSFHIIGHSLGAHVASFASNSVTTGNITRITGLDPALPLFLGRPASSRLDPSDALVVDCIHSCGGYLGFYTPLCSHDFYPNGGRHSQPGCGWDVIGSCSHGRSYRYFAVSIERNFTATSCTSFNQVLEKSCTGSYTGWMGDPAVQSEPGLYYLKTSKHYPYVLRT